jgi:hypothetical protein
MKCPKCKAPGKIVEARPLKGGINKRVRVCQSCSHEYATYEFYEADVKDILAERELTSKYNANSLCWSCKRATGTCSWSRNFEPVPGWEAEKTEVKNTYGKERFEMIASYDVKACPLYIKDIKRKEERK